MPILAVVAEYAAIDGGGANVVSIPDGGLGGDSIDTTAVQVGRAAIPGGGNSSELLMRVAEIALIRLPSKVSADPPAPCARNSSP